MKLRKGSNPYKILKHLTLGSGALLLSFLAPASAPRILQALYGGYMRRKRFEKERFLNDLKNLQKRELIDYKELSDGTIRIVITKKGKEKVLENQPDEMTLKRPRVWDGTWRLIMFDIPHSVKKGRDALRKKLFDFECYPLQKSVFITPFPCEDEIDFIASCFNVRDYVLILSVSSFEGEEKLKHHFKI